MRRPNGQSRFCLIACDQPWSAACMLAVVRAVEGVQPLFGPLVIAYFGRLRGKPSSTGAGNGSSRDQRTIDCLVAIGAPAEGQSLSACFSTDPPEMGLRVGPTFRWSAIRIGNTVFAQTPTSREISATPRLRTLFGAPSAERDRCTGAAVEAVDPTFNNSCSRR